MKEIDAVKKLMSNKTAALVIGNAWWRGVIIGTVIGFVVGWTFRYLTGDG